MPTIRYVVPDTSALAAAFYNETVSAHAIPLLQTIRSQTVEAIAPSLLLPEFLNVCRRKKQGNPSQGFAPVPTPLVEAIVNDMLALPLVLEETRPLTVGAWRLHQNHGIQTADAFFVEVARQWQAELWTADEQLFRSASQVYGSVFNLRTIPFS